MGSAVRASVRFDCTSLAGEIATRANVAKLVLTHFYPECDHANIEKQCRKTWSGPLVLAEDMMNIDFI